MSALRDEQACQESDHQYEAGISKEADETLLFRHRDFQLQSLERMNRSATRGSTDRVDTVQCNMEKRLLRI
jgi:hypothetical protein